MDGDKGRAGFGRRKVIIGIRGLSADGPGEFAHEKTRNSIVEHLVCGEFNNLFAGCGDDFRIRHPGLYEIPFRNV